MDSFEAVDDGALEFDEARASFFGAAATAHHGGVFGAVSTVFEGGFGFGADVFLDAIEDGEEFQEFAVFLGPGSGGGWCRLFYHCYLMFCF